MKILLDENLPQALRLELAGHEVFTVGFMNWRGIGNGKLLARAAEEGFDVLITTDRGIEFEQNRDMLPISVVVLLVSSNTIDAIRPLCPTILDTLRRLEPRRFVKLSSG